MEKKNDQNWKKKTLCQKAGKFLVGSCKHFIFLWQSFFFFSWLLDIAKWIFPLSRLTSRFNWTKVTKASEGSAEGCCWCNIFPGTLFRSSNLSPRCRAHSWRAPFAPAECVKTCRAYKHTLENQDFLFPIGLSPPAESQITSGRSNNHFSLIPLLSRPTHQRVAKVRNHQLLLLLGEWHSTTRDWIRFTQALTSRLAYDNQPQTRFDPQRRFTHESERP